MRRSYVFLHLQGEEGEPYLCSSNTVDVPRRKREKQWRTSVFMVWGLSFISLTNERWWIIQWDGTWVWSQANGSPYLWNNRLRSLTNSSLHLTKNEHSCGSQQLLPRAAVVQNVTCFWLEYWCVTLVQHVSTDGKRNGWSSVKPSNGDWKYFYPSTILKNNFKGISISISCSLLFRACTFYSVLRVLSCFGMQLLEKKKSVYSRPLFIF